MPPMIEATASTPTTTPPAIAPVLVPFSSLGGGVTKTVVCAAVGAGFVDSASELLLVVAGGASSIPSLRPVL